MVLLMLLASLAGCLGGDDEEKNDSTTPVAEDKLTIKIAGSSTVFPVADAWAQGFMASNSNYDVTVGGGGSGAGASQVCSTDTDHVDIGDMSRGWKSSEATVRADGYTYDCENSDIVAVQLPVAVDGLSVVVKKGGLSDQCIQAMGGLTMAQLRWVYSDWTEEKLVSDDNGGLVMASVTPNNDNDGVREWSDLHSDSNCAGGEIKLWGADSDSGTYEYFGEQVFCKNCFAGKDGYDAESFDVARGYENSADDNVIVNGINGDENAIGYFGYAYYEEARDKLNVVAIINNDTHGSDTATESAVSPNSNTVRDGSYVPLSREIYMNVDTTAWTHVLPYLEYGFCQEGQDDVAEVGYVPVSEEMWDDITSRIPGFDACDLGVDESSSNNNGNDGGETTVITGCTDSTATNYNPQATSDDGSCIMPEVMGCMNSNAVNYDSSATTDDGSCMFMPTLPQGECGTGDTIPIAGSSTVFPVADAWAQEFMADCSGWSVTVAGGGSGAGASRVCATDTDKVAIGDMSRGWKSSEATEQADGYTYDCANSAITVTQLPVAIDGLSVVVKKGGAADVCISEMGGLTMAQLRWIYSDWTETDLANNEDGGLIMSSVAPNNDNDGVREWSDLDADCSAGEIKLWGADSDSGTYEYFGEQVFCKNCFAGKDGYDAESFDVARGYENSADDNVIVNGLNGDGNAIGYFGYAYYEENKDKLNVVAISNNDTHGIADASETAIAPDSTTVRDGSYEPLSRFIYMNVDNSQWHLVRQFLNYGFSAEGQQDVADVGYVPLSDEMRAEMIARMWY